MNDEKVLNLAGGKVLYDDLRDRIKETAAEIPKATADVLRYTTQDLTEEKKAQARDNINAVSLDQMDVELNDLWNTFSNGGLLERVSGTTPTISAQPGTQYVCDEVTTLNITLPASGIVDVVFTSGSTPTVLTITAPAGVTLKWMDGFDPSALEANTTYELNIKDGLGVAGAWG